MCNLAVALVIRSFDTAHRLEAQFIIAFLLCALFDRSFYAWQKHGNTVEGTQKQIREVACTFVAVLGAYFIGDIID